MVVFHVLQLDFMDIAILRIFVVGEHKVQNPYGIDIFEAIVPVALDGLITDGEGGVVDTAVPEISLHSSLHLYDEFLTVSQLTIDIEHGSASNVVITQLFTVQVGQVCYLLLTTEEGVEKTD